MTQPTDELQRRVRRHRERVEQARREGDPSLAKGLAVIGTLGWLIVVPTVGGLLLGRWLDHRLGMGVTWTASLVFIGAALGGWMAWRRMQET